MKFCPQCGNELRAEAKFCASCGFNITSQQAPPPPPPQQPPQPAYTYSTHEASGAFTDALSGKTNLVQRVINILVKPKYEWPVIATELPNTTKLIFGYALVLALIPAIAMFIANGLIGTTMMGYTYRSISGGIMQALVQFFSALIGVYLLAWVIDMLAPSFDSEKNFGKSLQLAVYASTAQWVAGIFYIIPGVKWLAVIAGLYSIYLMVTGMPVIKRTPGPKVAGYVIITIIVMFVIALLLAFIIGAILGLLFFGSMGMRSMGM